MPHMFTDLTGFLSQVYLTHFYITFSFRYSSQLIAIPFLLTIHYYFTFSGASFLNTTTPSNTSTITGFDLSMSAARIFLLNGLMISFWINRFNGRAPNWISNP